MNQSVSDKTMMQNVMIKTALIFILVFIFPNLSLALVEGNWEINNTGTMKIIIEGEKTEKIKRTFNFNNYWTFRNDGSFEIDTETIGRWEQKGKKIILDPDWSTYTELIKTFIER